MVTLDSLLKAKGKPYTLITHRVHLRVSITFNGPTVIPLCRVTEHGCRFKGVRGLDNLPFCRLSDYLNTNSSKAM